MLGKIKKISSEVVDFCFVLLWLSFSIPLLGCLLKAENDWKNVTFGEFFGLKIWFNLWVISIFYWIIRLVLRDRFWKIIYKEKTED